MSRVAAEARCGTSKQVTAKSHWTLIRCAVAGHRRTVGDGRFSGRTHARPLKQRIRFSSCPLGPCPCYSRPNTSVVRERIGNVAIIAIPNTSMACGPNNLPVGRHNTLQRAGVKKPGLIPNHSPAKVTHRVAQIFVPPVRNTEADCLNILGRKLPPNRDLGTGGRNIHPYGKPDENGHQ